MRRWKMAAIPVSAALVGLGCATLFFLMSSSQWGAPGTDAYRLYEARNRLIPVPLMLVAVGVVAAYLPLRAGLGWLGHISFLVGLLGTALMLGGNVAEFWLFSHQPYGQVNPRAIAWSSFLLGAAVLLVGLTLLAAAIVGRKQDP